MKVILLQDVARIGRRFEVQNVPDGHALNFLIPRGMAEPATEDNLKRLHAKKSKIESDLAQAGETFRATCEKLVEEPVQMSVSANEQGHLFQSVKADDIAAHVTKEIGPLDAHHIMIDTPIKEVGEYTIKAVSGDAECTFTLMVTAA